MPKPYFNLIHKPFYITQKWGIPDPVYEQFGFSRHNGTDSNTGDGKIIFPLYAPFPCEVINIGYHPKGSGIFLTVISNETFVFPDGKSAKILLDFLHLKVTMVPIRQKLKVGEIFAFANNTGFSTGRHVHIQPRRVKGVPGAWQFVDNNDAHNSFDIMPYSTSKYAEDLADLSTNIVNFGRLVSYFISSVT